MRAAGRVDGFRMGRIVVVAVFVVVVLVGRVAGG